MFGQSVDSNAKYEVESYIKLSTFIRSVTNNAFYFQFLFLVNSISCEIDEHVRSC